jgi:hypothetical protein
MVGELRGCSSRPQWQVSWWIGKMVWSLPRCPIYGSSGSSRFSDSCNEVWRHKSVFWDWLSEPLTPVDIEEWAEIVHRCNPQGDS